jgi:hypothetical protein
MSRQRSLPGSARWVRRFTASIAVLGAATVAAIAPFSRANAAPTHGTRTVRHANLLTAIDDLPDYFAGVVHWDLSTDWKHYGTTDWDTNTITISAFTPLNLLYSVVAHEWSHEIQAYDYRGDLWAGVVAMNHHFGGAGKTGQRGIEYAADCMAILQGATWTNYTPCHHTAWRADARRLLDGHRLTTTAKKATGTTGTSQTGTPQPDQ